MKLYCGIDLHANNNVISIQDEQDNVYYEKRLPNDLGVIVTALQAFQKELQGCVVESTYNGYWLVYGLAEAGFPVHLANTAAIPQYAGIKYTNDDTDARHLAHLLLQLGH
ncbi:MAG: transposase [Candidatus Thiodiazotropha sp.]